MKIELREFTVREVAAGYNDSAEEGVIGYGGQLNIRPRYQREFVYKDKQRDAVIESIKKNFPLNVMYWAKNEDGSFEVIDGQQRTISFCQYVTGGFSIDYKYIHNLTNVEQNQIFDYKLMIYICEGNDKEKLDWFRIVNIAGEKLTEQELRNAVYSGSWLIDAKPMFSKSNCAAYLLAKDYVSGSPIRQEFLEIAIDWISGGNIEDYMSKHQHEQNANELWLYFRSVIDWVGLTFKNYRKEMKGINWGNLYNKFKDKKFNTDGLEKEIAKLMQDDDVTKKPGIYTYVLTREEKYLNIRAFSDNMKREAYERQNGICPKCNEHFKIEQMEADHITPWSEGGPTAAANCQMLCKNCNRIKSNK